MADVVVRDARSNFIIASYVKVIGVPRVGEYLETYDGKGHYWKVLAVSYEQGTDHSATLYVDSQNAYILPDFSRWMKR